MGQDRVRYCPMDDILKFLKSNNTARLLNRISLASL